MTRIGSAYTTLLPFYHLKRHIPISSGVKIFGGRLEGNEQKFIFSFHSSN
jgi:hypothetical protein